MESIDWRWQVGKIHSCVKQNVWSISDWTSLDAALLASQRAVKAPIGSHESCVKMSNAIMD